MSDTSFNSQLRRKFRQTQADSLSNKLAKIKADLMKVYDYDTKLLSCESVNALHEVIKALYRAESTVKEYR